MAGIVSIGAYVPRYRMPRMTVFMNMGWFNPVTMSVSKGEKAVAAVDQDSITMAVDAAAPMVPDGKNHEIDVLYYASTTLPWKERLNAGIIASALDLRPDLRAADFAAGLKAGTSALIAGLEAAAAGKKVLVAASDSRLGRPGSMQEMFFGDAAAAALLGDGDVIASYVDSYSLTYDFADHVRREDRRFDRTWEERWIRDLGYSRMIPQAINGLLSKTGNELKDVAKFIYPCHFDRVHGGLAKKAGIEPDKVQDNLGTTVGDSGAAHPLLMLAAALESASPGDKIVLVGYGSGADAVMFEAGDAVKDMDKSFSAALARREELQAYTKYLVWNSVLPVEVGIRGELQAPTALSELWRSRESVQGLMGSKCKKCGNVVYPIDRVCPMPECGAVDEMEKYMLRDKPAKIFTYTGDMLAFSFDPPQFYGMIDFEEGARLQLDLTDCKQEDLKVGMPVDMTFRRKYSDDLRGLYGYVWKAAPRVGE